VGLPFKGFDRNPGVSNRSNYQLSDRYEFTQFCIGKEGNNGGVLAKRSRSKLRAIGPELKSPPPKALQLFRDFIKADVNCHLKKSQFDTVADKDDLIKRESVG